ncbi:MAG: hypothetical protein ACLUMN_07640 [Oscillospiraceae bacterium]
MKRIFNGSGGRKTALILSLCLIFALAVGTTFALLKASTAPVENTFTAAKSDIKIDEDVTGGQKKSIIVKNTGTAVSYVRVKLVMNWVDENGNVSAEPVNIMPSITDNWFLKDGIYYYKMPVAAKDFTTNLLKTPITQDAAPEGYHLEVTVLAESIQAAPSAAVQQSWGVGVDSNGYLTQPTTTP